MMRPANVLAAVTHVDPYPYYAECRAGPALVFDAQLKLWVAARAEVVIEVMNNPACRVRPVSEPVPRAIATTSSGEIFGHLVRMNEGEKHGVPKLALGRALAALPPSAIDARAAAIAGRLVRELDPFCAASLNAWLFLLPVSVVASLIGFEDSELPDIARCMSDFVRCLSPMSTPGQLAAAARAADALLDRFQIFVAATPAPGTLAAQVGEQARELGWSETRAVLANLIGLLSQTYEATAGLLGNCLIARFSRPAIAAQLGQSASLLPDFVEEVGRFDPAVQNTRRFVAQATTVAGVELAPGDAILLCLAAASRDPAYNRDPGSFLLERDGRQGFGFGHGPHACPGQALANRIAAAGLAALPDLDLRGMSWTFRPSANARLPEFISHPSSKPSGDKP
jgi:cytochrome P450